MKKITAVILLFCLFFTLLGHHLIFRLRLFDIKKEMKERLRDSPTKDVVVLYFSEDEIHLLEWEDDYEFRFGNEMYDVIDQKKEGGRFILRCIPDTKETALLEAYQKIAQKKRDSPVQASLIKLISSQFIIVAYSSLDPPKGKIKTAFFQYSSPLPINIASAVKHPPKFANRPDTFN